MKTTRKYITIQMPGSFFPEETVQRVESFDVPKKLPLDCFAFQFHETEFIVDGKKEYEGDTKRQDKRHLIGWKVPLANIPNDDRHSILRCNIECNSPTKTAVRTHLGNWQAHDKNVIVHDPSEFAFTAPLIWKKIKQISAP